MGHLGLVDGWTSLGCLVLFWASRYSSLGVLWDYFFFKAFFREERGGAFCLISAKWTTGYKGEIKTTEPRVYELAKMDDNWELSWVVLSVGCNELTNLTWSQIFLVKMHLSRSIWSSSKLCLSVLPLTPALTYCSS